MLDSLDITPVRHEDFDEVEEILSEMDRFYGTPDERPFHERRAEVSEALLGPQPCAWALLARRAGDVVGIATYSFLWPAVGTTRALYLKELYIRHGSRGCGVGTALLHHVRKLALAAGCSRLEWHADADNPQAHAFYRRFLAPDPPERRLRYRLEGEPLRTAHEWWPQP